MHFPWLYEPQLVDVSDLVAEMEKKYGKAMPSAAETAQVNGVWRAVPQYHAMFVAAFREDLFKKAGLKAPDTWEDLYTVGKELKKMGNPIGIPISQNYDSISTASAVMWCYGAGRSTGTARTLRSTRPRRWPSSNGTRRSTRTAWRRRCCPGPTPATTSRSSRARRDGSTTP